MKAHWKREDYLVNAVEHVCKHIHVVLLAQGVFCGMVPKIQLGKCTVHLCLSANLRNKVEREKECNSDAQNMDIE